MAIGIGDKLWDSFLTISIRKKSDQACQTGVCHLWNIGSTATNSLNGWSYKLLISTRNIALRKKKKRKKGIHISVVEHTACFSKMSLTNFLQSKEFFMSNYIASVAVSDWSFLFSCMNIRYFSICNIWLHHSDNNSLILTFLVS